MQLRQMQLGGNAKATAFFRQQNANSNDTQEKYNSRAAQLYREKLHQAAAQAMRLHGTKLHIETGAEVDNEERAKEEDFFAAQHEQVSLADNSISSNHVPTSSNGDLLKDNGPAPNVDVALPSSKPAPRKATIGGRKPIAKKPGLGGKKGGLGAQKTTKSFAEVEREAEMADQVANENKAVLLQTINDVKTEEENAKAMANIRLAYQDLSVKQKKQEEKMASTDPSKAAQVERLGMGFGTFGGGGRSHSLVSGMKVIEQEEPNHVKKTNFKTSTKDKFLDDFEIIDSESKMSSRVDEICEPARGSDKSTAWEKRLNQNIKSSKKTESSNWDNDYDSKTSSKTSDYSSSRKTSSNTSSYSSSRRPPAPVTSAPSSEDAVKRYGNAKSISSDQFFGGDEDDSKDANMSRFQGSNSISSAEYFGRNEGMSTSSSSYGANITGSISNYGANLRAPDMDDVKESVKMGVSKVAGRLSGYASGVMGQIQDKYGYGS